MFISDCFLLRCIPYKTLKAIWKQLSPNNASVVDSFWYDALSKRIQKATKNQALESSNFTEICHSSPVVPPLLLLQDLPCAWPKTNGSTGRSSQEYWDFSHGLIPGFTRDIPLYTAYPNSITRMTRMTMIFGWRCEPGIFNLILKGRKDWNLLGDNQENIDSIQGMIMLGELGRQNDLPSHHSTLKVEPWGSGLKHLCVFPHLSGEGC